MELRSKQQLLDRDRSHPNLRTLDSLKLTYPGWKDDFATVEKDYQSGDYWFDQQLFLLKERRRMTTQVGLLFRFLSRVERGC
jgi:hypothetical protein